METKFNYHESTWTKVRAYFDEIFSAPPFETSKEVKYAKYLDSENKPHIVSLFNDNRFAKSDFDLEFDKLHEFLNKLNSTYDGQIHIACDSYIASVREGDYFLKQIKDNVKYYYLVTDFIDNTSRFEDITRLMLNLKNDFIKNKGKRKSRTKIDDTDDPFSEKRIMRDLMNGDGEKHGY